MQRTAQIRWMLWLAALWLVIAWPALADEAPLPVLHGRVNDYARVLGANAASIEAKLAAEERATGNQVVVLTVTDLGGRDIESYANEVLHGWKLGRKGVDDGVLIVLAVKDRHARIEVGYGLEGTLTDLASSRILRDSMHPHFAAGDYAGGMEAGVDAVLAALAGQQAQGTPIKHDDAWAPWWAFILPLVMATLFGGIAAAAGGWKILWLPLLCLLFPFGMAPWPAALGIVSIYLAGIFGLRYRWMRAEYLQMKAGSGRRSKAPAGSWPPGFMDVWRWHGVQSNGKRRRRAHSSAGAVAFLDRDSSSDSWSSSSSSSSDSSSDSFSGGGGDSGGGGSSDSW